MNQLDADAQKEFKELKSKIKPSNKLKNVPITLLCLNFVEKYPEYLNEVGCCWKDDNSFIINSNIFSHLIQRKCNSINRCFRCHNFKVRKISSQIIKNLQSKFNFSAAVNPKGWVERYCEGFHKNTTFEEASKMKRTLIPVNKLFAIQN